MLYECSSARLTSLLHSAVVRTANADRRVVQAQAAVAAALPPHDNSPVLLSCHVSVSN